MSSRKAVWVARREGRAVAFGTELDALRYAVDRSMEVVRVPYGENVLTHPAVVESEQVSSDE